MPNILNIDQLPDHQSAQLARESAAEVTRLLGELPAHERAHLKMGDTDLIVPRHAIELLRNVLAEMAQGNAVSILPVHAELTTQEAADLLNVSRPHLIKLLQSGVLPFSKVGTHRRINLKDLLTYKQRRDDENNTAMQALVDEAQELEMGY